MIMAKGHKQLNAADDSSSEDEIVSTDRYISRTCLIAIIQVLMRRNNVDRSPKRDILQKSDSGYASLHDVEVTMVGTLRRLLSTNSFLQVPETSTSNYLASPR